MSTEKDTKVPMRILEGQAGNLRVLIYLSTVGETNFQGIVEGLPLTGRSLYGVIDKLKGLDLIKTRIDKSSYPQKIMVSLTERGKKVAKRLKEIEEILEENP
jgi:DNA-binding MarR family transcriptional regulator